MTRIFLELCRSSDILADLKEKIEKEIFPGNTFDGKTLPAALEALEKRFGIRKVVIVADRGIASKVNLPQYS